MAAPMLRCVCHVVHNEQGSVSSFTDVSWDKICYCMQVWANLDGEEKEIAQQFKNTARNTAGYHRRCYQRFTDKRRLEQGEKRKSSGSLRPVVNEPEDDTCGGKPNQILLRSEMARSSTNSSVRRSKFVLPEECIICRKQQMVVDQSTRQRKVERLVNCETDARKLLEAAQLKQDERIILQIGELDPVCIEVRYHASCYKRYTKCVYTVKETSGRPLAKSFDIFCQEVVDKKIISGGEVLRMNYLNKLFTSTVKDVEQIDLDGYRNYQLKARLSARYSELEFIQPKSRCCELVFHNKCADRTVINVNDSESESDSEFHSDSSDHEHCDEDLPTVVQPSPQDDFAELYHAAAIIRASLTTVSSVSMWPPGSLDLSFHQCSDIVPACLFNFLAWCCGMTEDFQTNKVEIDENAKERKLISIAQDLISLASQGRKLMPKHLALGMTIRHLTGSSKLHQLLNAFGHCVSHSVTLEHDTALATKQLRDGNDIPVGFQSGAFTTLVWDNNDFGEETLTGKGTTHNTNGIIIQRNGHENSSSAQVSRNRDRKRTIEAPSLEIDHFHGQKRSGPVQFRGKTPDIERYPAVQKEPRFIDQAIVLAKYCQTDALLPGWTGCNQLISSDSYPVNKIGYLPVIDASPTDKSTVNTILEKSLDIAASLNLPCVVLVFDQAIYAKAQEIRWQGRPEFRERLILRLGEFHTAMAFLGAVGKRFESAGLKDIAIESGLVAEGSINGVVSGHHYNRSIRCHKIMSEALHRLRIEQYINQLPPDECEKALLAMQMLQDSFPENFMNSLPDKSLQDFTDSYREYVDLKCSQNSMYSFWTSYLDMIELLLLFIRATRQGNWELHLSTIRDMIPWFFAYGRINYSRYLPVYYHEMRDLQSTHPSVYSRLADGEFAVKRHDSHPFALTACDQVIEQTYNRDSKTRGGLTGLTLNKGAVRRWILSHPARAAIADSCYSMSTGKNVTTSYQQDLVSTRKRTDEQAIQDVMDTINGFSNPFSIEEENQLVNICSGKVAPDNVQSDLASAYSRGEECFKSYVNERLVEGKTDLFDKLSLPTGKTFSDIDKKAKSKASLVNSSMTENRKLLARLLVIAQVKELDLKDVLKHPLCTFPSALANFDGTMAKTNKAALLHEVEKSCPSESRTREVIFKPEAVVIVDAMAMIQQQRSFPETFGAFAINILKQLVSTAKKYKAKRIDFVADQYRTVSIKQYERMKRTTQGENVIRINSGVQKMPKQMKKFFACGKNKEGLLMFLVSEWKKSPPHVLSNVCVYATEGDACVRIFQSLNGSLCVEGVPELCSDQEEADTRMFLHALHAAQSASESTDTDIIIRTVDTDVFIIALWISCLLYCRIILLLTIGGNSRCVDVQEISKSLGDNTAEAIVGLHCFTGCDSVSAFKGKGKVKAFKLLVDSPTYQKTFCELGKEWRVPVGLQQELEKFVCDLYGWKDCCDIDTVRYNSFRLGHVSDTTMPPNHDSLALHSMRANYQAKLCRTCLQTQSCPPNADGYGWEMIDSRLHIKWNTMAIAPDSVLNSVNCSCRKTLCDSNKCSCRKGGIECTDMCKCDNCHNRVAQVNSDSDSDDEIA